MNSFQLVPSQLGPWLLEKGLISAQILEQAQLEQQKLLERGQWKALQSILHDHGQLRIDQIEPLLTSAFVLPFDALPTQSDPDYDAKRLLNSLLSLSIGASSAWAKLKWTRDRIQFEYESEGATHEGSTIPLSVSSSLRRAINFLLSGNAEESGPELSGALKIGREGRKYTLRWSWNSRSYTELSFAIRPAEPPNHPTELNS